MATATAPESASAQMIKKAGKGKGKKAATSKPESDIDLIVSTVVEIEHLSRDAAVELGHTLTDDTDFNYFKLGGVLSVLMENGWYKELGYDSWPDFINEEYGLGKRKSQYLIQIYNGLVESGVAWDDVKDLKWTKLKELSHILTKENAAEWVEIARDLTVLQLQEKIKQFKATGSLDAQTTDDEQAAANSTNVSTLTYKVHPDQKETITSAVEKAMTEIGSEFKPVALEAICMNYLSGEKVKAVEAPADHMSEEHIETVMKQIGWEQVLEHFENVFPDIEVSFKV